MKNTPLFSALLLLLVASGCAAEKTTEPESTRYPVFEGENPEQAMPAPPPPPDINDVPDPSGQVDLAGINEPPQTPPPPASLEASGGDVILEQEVASEIWQLILDKYELEMDEVKINVTNKMNTKARGEYSIKTENGFSEPKVFLTAKVIGKWRLVHDGGEMSCVTVSKYGFPAELTPECVGNGRPDTSTTRNPPAPEGSDITPEEVEESLPVEEEEVGLEADTEAKDESRTAETVTPDQSDDEEMSAEE